MQIISLAIQAKKIMQSTNGISETLTWTDTELVIIILLLCSIIIIQLC